MENNYGSMTINEERIYKIDKSKTRNCQLYGSKDDPNIIEIKIKKIKDDRFESRFIFFMEGSRDTELICSPGYLNNVNVEATEQGCEISKILARLCFNEDTIHEVENVLGSQAVKPLDEKQKQWIISTCSKILYLQMVAKPRDRAGLYFKSAKASGYNQMIVNLVDEKTGAPTTYPKKGPCCVDELEKRYDGNGYMVHGGQKVHVAAASWVFCLPKQPPPSECCTIL